MNRASILYLVPDLVGPPGGIARHSRHVTLALQGAGIPVGVVALHDRREMPPQAADLAMSYHPCAGNRVRFLGTTLRLLAARPSLVLVGHVHLLPPVLIPAHALGIPVAVFLHGVEAWEPLPGMRGWSLRHADRVIAVSDYSARRASAANAIPADRVRTVPSSLGPDAFPRPVNATTAGSSPHLLSVGRLSRDEGYKGHRQVIEALPLVRKEYRDLIYDIVGDGDDRPVLEALAREQGLEGSVRFHGQVSDHALEELYAAATLFALPSSGEGFGFVFLDAMAHGLPVLAGNRDATPEVVTDGETGILVDPGDVRAVGDALLTLLRDHTLCDRLGQAGRRRVEEHFGFSSFQQRLLQALADVSTRLAVRPEAR